MMFNNFIGKELLVIEGNRWILRYALRKKCFEERETRIVAAISNNSTIVRT